VPAVVAAPHNRVSVWVVGGGGVGEGFGGEELQQAGNYSIRSELDLLPSL
jgi:hypothetical protein